jgi:hypothetical protein
LKATCQQTLLMYVFAAYFNWMILFIYANWKILAALVIWRSPISTNAVNKSTHLSPISANATYECISSFCQLDAIGHLFQQNAINSSCHFKEAPYQQTLSTNPTYLSPISTNDVNKKLLMSVFPGHGNWLLLVNSVNRKLLTSRIIWKKPCT